jgi:hypothetical protein
MLEPRGRNNMAKNLRCDLNQSQFLRFKRIKAESNSMTNDEALVHLMDAYEEDQAHCGDEDND